MSRLRQAVDAGDAAAVQHEAHSLKGLVAHFDAEAAAAPLIRLEKMGSLGDLSDASKALVELEQELSRLEGALTVQLGELSPDVL